MPHKIVNLRIDSEEYLSIGSHFRLIEHYPRANSPHYIAVHELQKFLLQAHSCIDIEVMGQEAKMCDMSWR